MSQQASKYVENLASLYSNLEQICTEKEVEEQFDRDFDESLKMLSESRCIKVAETYARIEEDLNEGLGVVRNHFQETGTASLALTCGKNDRGHNEVLYLQETLAVVDYAGQGYARRRLRGGRDEEVGGVMNKVRQGERSQDEMDRSKSM